LLSATVLQFTDELRECRQELSRSQAEHLNTTRDFMGEIMQLKDEVKDLSVLALQATVDRLQAELNA
jgi:hypothetical protein